MWLRPDPNVCAWRAFQRRDGLVFVHFGTFDGDYERSSDLGNRDTAWMWANAWINEVKRFEQLVSR